MGTVEAVYRRSLADPAGFWEEAARDIEWIRPAQRVLDDSEVPFFRWFAGGELNTCHNALDRHVGGGRADQLALVCDSPVTSTVQRFTYRELRAEVAGFAGALAARGVGKGDRVVISMPMVPHAVIAMLACARIGAIHSVVFGGFAAAELASRIDHAKPKAIVFGSCGIEGGRVVEYAPLVNRALELSAHQPQFCIVAQRLQAKAELVSGRDVDWDDAVADAHPAGCVPVAATDPLYILYTSGTTAQPKGVVRDNGGPRRGVALVDDQHLRDRAGRGVLGGFGHRLDRRPLLHRLCPVAGRRHHGAVRGQARGHPRPGRVLAGHLRAQREDTVHRTDGGTRDQEGRSAREVPLPV